MPSANETVDLTALRINRTAPKKKSGNLGKYIGIGVLVLVLGGGLYVLKNSELAAIEVETATATVVSSAQANSVLTANGYVVAQRKAAVSSKATGRLESLLVIEGDQVRTGQIIGRIESRDVEAMLDQAKASLATAKASLETAKTELEDAELNLTRQKNLRAQNVNTSADLTNAEAREKRARSQVAFAEASIKVAEANVKSANVQVENTIIRAPFDGTVLNKNANVGEVITSLGAAAGARGAVVTLADMSSLEVEADVSESSIEKIRSGQSCQITLTAFPDKSYRGFVHKIIPTADRAKATVLTKIRFSDRDQSVLPEMSARVQFLKDSVTASEPSKLTIPASAITKRDGKPIVFLMKNGKATATLITIGSVSTQGTEILSGIEAGDKVILRPSEKIADGVAVKLKEK